MVVGGAEDRRHDRVILRRFLELSGGPQARIRILSAASADPEAAWQTYRRAFEDLGAQDLAPLRVPDREAADSAELRQEILSAQGIYISGGAQGRLMNLLWDTEAYRALHLAFHLRGCCLAGTSAGAAAMSRAMLVQGEATLLPEKEAADLDLGLGLLHGAIVDQHFSQRRRLSRLLSVLAQRPDQWGVGVDEDTALVVERGAAIEVIGQGAVTLIDPRGMVSNHQDADEREHLELLGVRMHVLPAGKRYALNAPEAKRWPASLRHAVLALTTPGPIRG